MDLALDEKRVIFVVVVAFKDLAWKVLLVWYLLINSSPFPRTLHLSLVPGFEPALHGWSICILSLSCLQLCSLPFSLQFSLE